jgi:hypothetical protein
LYDRTTFKCTVIAKYNWIDTLCLFFFLLSSFFVWYTQYCLCLWIINSWLPIRFPLTFITFGGSGLIWGMTFGGSSLIWWMTFGGSGFIIRGDYSIYNIATMEFSKFWLFRNSQTCIKRSWKKYVTYTVKSAHVVTSIKQSPVFKGHLFLVLP